MIRLKNNHPLSQNLEKVFKLMDELGIKIEIGGYNTSVYYNGIEYSLKDIDSNSFPINELPPIVEYKITYHDEEKENMLQKRQNAIMNDICPECSGELDTGWECNKCKFDVKSEVNSF